jgi:hypothetical protein
MRKGNKQSFVHDGRWPGGEEGIGPSRILKSRITDGHRQRDGHLDRLRTAHECGMPFKYSIDRTEGGVNVVPWAHDICDLFAFNFVRAKQKAGHSISVLVSG